MSFLLLCDKTVATKKKNKYLWNLKISSIYERLFRFDSNVVNVCLAENWEVHVTIYSVSSDSRKKYADEAMHVTIYVLLTDRCTMVYTGE